MTPKQSRFVEEYLVDLNGKQAAIRAGYSEKTAEVQASRLLSNAKVADAVARGQEARSEKLEITQDMVLKRWWDIATADPNDLVQFRRTCCRHCHGDGHRYQWVDGDEFAEALLMAKEADAKELPSDAGGYGYDRTADPHEDCPKCAGEGRADVYGLDTRRLSGGAKLLYAGVKVTRDGFEIKMHDQLKALDSAAKHLGMFTERHEHSGPNGGPIETENLTWRELLRQQTK